MKRWFIFTIVMAVFGVAANYATALSVSPSGEVVGWGVTPFVNNDNGVVVTDIAPGVTSYLQNDWAPINYPGVGNVPSPGGRTGEQFDLEEMHVRVVGDEMQFLLVASSEYEATAGATYSLGDLMLNVDGVDGFDYGLVTLMGNAGLTAGGLYDIDTTRGLQGAYANNPTIAAEIGPWAVQTGMMVSQEDIDTADHDYGNPNNRSRSWWEDNTTLYEFSVDLAAIDGPRPESIDFQIAWGCGNDVIGGTFDVPSGGGPGDGQQTNGVPEPATAMLGLIGMGGLAARVGRKTRPRR